LPAVPPDLTRPQSKIDAGDHAFDTLAGGVVRLFASHNEDKQRIDRLEQAYRELRSRVARLEDGGQASRPPPTYDGRRITAFGEPDTRGSSPAARFAHRHQRSTKVAANARQVADGQGESRAIIEDLIEGPAAE
jgi:hypothetical protein